MNISIHYVLLLSLFENRFELKTRRGGAEEEEKFVVVVMEDDVETASVLIQFLKGWWK